MENPPLDFDPLIILLERLGHHKLSQTFVNDEVHIKRTTPRYAKDKLNPDNPIITLDSFDWAHTEVPLTQIQDAFDDLERLYTARKTHPDLDWQDTFVKRLQASDRVHNEKWHQLFKVKSVHYIDNPEGYILKLLDNFGEPMEPSLHDRTTVWIYSNREICAIKKAHQLKPKTAEKPTHLIAMGRTELTRGNKYLLNYPRKGLPYIIDNNGISHEMYTPLMGAILRNTENNDPDCMWHAGYGDFSLTKEQEQRAYAGKAHIAPHKNAFWTQCTSTQQATSHSLKESTPKMTTVTITITTPTLVNGQDVEKLNAMELIEMIKMIEDDIENLGKVKAPSKAIDKMVNAHQTTINKLVKLLDAKK